MTQHVDLRRDEITHRTLAICVTGTPTLSREHTGDHWRIYVNGLAVRNAGNLRAALTTLTSAGLITWSKVFMSSDTEQAKSTEAGEQKLIEWDTELFSGSDT